MLKKFLILTFSLFFLTGCTNKNNFEEISFSSWGSQSEVEIIKKVISEFENENPSIKVRFLHFPQNYFQKLHLLFASNQAPDVIFINNLHLPIYKNYLEDLSSIIDKNNYYKSSIDGLSINNTLYAIPRDVSNLVLYVNTENVALADSNWNIQNLIQVAKKYKEKELWGISYEDEIYWITPYLSYFGGGILDTDCKIIIDSEESKKAISFYKDMQKKYLLAPTKSQVGSLTQAQMFINGKLGMYLSGRWMYPKIKEKAEFNWAVINFPYGAKPQLSDCSGWAISKNSKNKESAKKFVQYLASKKTADYFTQTGLIVPARKDSSEVLYSEEHNEKIFLETLSKTVNTPVNKDYNKIIDRINRELEL